MVEKLDAAYHRLLDGPFFRKQLSEDACGGLICLQSPGREGGSDEVCKGVLFTALWPSANRSIFIQR